MLGCLGLLVFLLLLLLPRFAIYHSRRLRRCLSLHALCSGLLLLPAIAVHKRASLHWCSTSLASLYSDNARQQSALWPAQGL